MRWGAAGWAAFEANDYYGLDPADVDVEALKEAASTTYSLDDDNFTEPSFNERVKDYGMADPEVYEPLAEDPWCGDDPPSSED